MNAVYFLLILTSIGFIAVGLMLSQDERDSDVKNKISFGEPIGGLGLALLGGLNLYSAFISGVVSGKGHSVSMSDSPVAFYCMVVAHLFCLGFGLALIVRFFKRVFLKCSYCHKSLR